MATEDDEEVIEAEQHYHGGPAMLYTTAAVEGIPVASFTMNYATTAAGDPARPWRPRVPQTPEAPKIVEPPGGRAIRIREAEE